MAISTRTLCKIGTIAANKSFTPRDFREYTGAPSSQLRDMVKRGLIRKVGRSSYYPTGAGWDAIERACKRS